MLFALLLAVEFSVPCPTPKLDVRGCMPASALKELMRPECQKVPLPRCWYAPIVIVDAHGHEIDGDHGKCPEEQKRTVRVDVYGGGKDWAVRAQKACEALLKTQPDMTCSVGTNTPAEGPVRFKLVVEGVK